MKGIVHHACDGKGERDMDSNSSVEAAKPHAICVPLPVQSHIKAMLKFSKLLHQKGFYITFVNTEFNHQRFINSGAGHSFDGLPDFRFKTIPDGLPPPSDPNATQNFLSLCDSIANNMLPPFSDLLENLNNPPVTCIVSDPYMTFTLTAAEKLGIPIVMLFTISACALMLCNEVSTVRDKGLIPLKDESTLTNGYLETTIDWIPCMKDIRLRDFPSFIRTTDPNNATINIVMEVMEKAVKASGIVIHTFDTLESEVLGALSLMFPRVYAIGPLQLLLNNSPNDPLKSIGYSLWKEEDECLHWLDSKAPNSVMYVNFGSIAIMTQQQLLEFAWGIANSNFPFLLIIRPDLVIGRPSPIFPPEFLSETKERGVIATWCSQEKVLNHPAVGAFLTHCGWNSIIESLLAGVPLLCCPFFGDQQTNCRHACTEWSIGMEIDNNAPREEVEKLVRELMEGENGKKIKNKVLEWKKLAEEATDPYGSSSRNLESLVNLLL